MTRLLFILEYFVPHIGGVETLFDNLTKQLCEKGYKVDVFTSLVPGAKSFEESGGRRIFRVPIAGRNSFAFTNPRKLIDGADLLHTTSYVAAGTTYLSNFFKRKPTLLTIHEIWGKLWFEFEPTLQAFAHNTLESMMLWAYRKNEIICPSEYTRKALLRRGFQQDKVHTIPHGIDHETFNTSAKPLRKFKNPTYFFFGRPGISKGSDYLLEAVKEISKEIPESKLILMLSKSDKNQYNKAIKKISELGIEKNIIFEQSKPTTKEVAQMIKSVDCVVVPSISEGFGFNAVEAQACGVPVIASKAGSLPEVVKGGILVEPKNPEAIADAVVKILSDKKLATKLGKTGSQYVARYNWTAATNSYIKIYEKLLS